MITMLEELGLYILQRLLQMNKIAFSLEDNITPSIKKRLEVLKEKQRHWIMYPSGFQELEVRKGDDSFGVNLLNKVAEVVVGVVEEVEQVEQVVETMAEEVELLEQMGVVRRGGGNNSEEDLWAEWGSGGEAKWKRGGWKYWEEKEKANDGSRDGEQVIFQNNTTQPTQQSMIHGEPAEPFDQATHKDTAVDGEHKPGDQATHEDIAVMDKAIHDEPLDNRKGKAVDDTLEPEQPTKKRNMQKWQE
ncbi:hypothetical protein Tco_0496924 [Tanacetum coccineum]